MERIATGGQAGTSSRIENYLGFPGGISGADLAERAVLRPQKFGARIMVPRRSPGWNPTTASTVVTLADGRVGGGQGRGAGHGSQVSQARRPGNRIVRGQRRVLRRHRSEAMLCARGPVVIVGGGNSAGQAAVFLAARVSRVYVVIRGDDLNGTCRAISSTRSRRHPRVTVRSAPRSGRCTETVPQRGGTRNNRDRRAALDRDPRPVRLHRRGSRNGMARRRHRTRRPRFRADRPGRALLGHRWHRGERNVSR